MSNKHLESLELMTWAEKCKYFVRKDAFYNPKKPGEERARPLRLPKAGLPKINASSLTLDAGHITRITKPIIGRPCFGIPAARLVHGYSETTIVANGVVRLTRCGGCPLKDACQYVVDERLHHTSMGIRDAHRDFTRRGGGAAVWKSGNKGSSVRGALQYLTSQLAGANLTNVNDQYVADHYEAVAEQRAAEERARKQAQRLSDGTSISSAVINELKAEHRLREARIVQAKALPDAPHWLARTPDTVFFGLVWLCKQALSIAGRKHGATHIARYLQDRLARFASNDHGGLRNRVDRTLKRFPDLEALTLLDGEPCWPQSHA